MKKILIAGLTFIFTVSLFTSCQDASVTSDMDDNRLNLALALANGDYETISQSLDNPDALSQAEFDELRETISGSSTVSTYQLLKYDNGNMLLLEMSDINGKVFIHDVILLSEEEKSIFN